MLQESGSRKSFSLAALIFLLISLWGHYAMQFPGPSEEEIILYQAALRQRQWSSLLSQQGVRRAFSAETLKRYWSLEELPNQSVSNSPSPFLCTLYGLIQYPAMLIARPFESFRSASVLAFALLGALIFFWLRERIGTLGALSSCALFVLTPRAFAAGLQATSYPLLALLTFIAAYLLEPHQKRGCRILLFGLVVGLGLAVSIQFLITVFCLVFWKLASGQWRAKGKFLVSGLAGMLVLPVLLNPLWWQEPVTGFSSWLTESMKNYARYTIPVLYLGKLYQSRLPWHYVIVMLVVTMPVALVALAITGKFISMRRSFFKGPAGFALTVSTTWILVAMSGYFPAADGMAWFLPLFAADAIMAGYAFLWFTRRIEASRSARARGLGIILLVVMLIPPAVLQVKLFPCMSSHYNVIIGFLEGAEKAGMEICFDGSAACEEFISRLNETVGRGERLKAVGVPLYFLKRLGRIRSDIVPDQLHYDKVVILNRPGAFEDQHRLLFENREPVLGVKRGGVLLLGLFEVEKESTRCQDKVPAVSGGSLANPGPSIAVERTQGLGAGGLTIFTSLPASIFRVCIPAHKQKDRLY